MKLRVTQMVLIWNWNLTLQPPLVWFGPSDQACTSIRTPVAGSMLRRRWKEENGGQDLWGRRHHAVFLSQCELDQFLRDKKAPCLSQIANRPWLLAPQRVQVMSVHFWQTPFSHTNKCSAIWFGSDVWPCSVIVPLFLEFPWDTWFSQPCGRCHLEPTCFILCNPLIQQVKGRIDLI